MTSHDLDRRLFLELLGLSVAASQLPACGQPSPSDEPEDTDLDTAVDQEPEQAPEPTDMWEGMAPEDGSSFPMAVQAGDNRADQAIFSTRYLGDEDLTLHLATHDGAWTELKTLSAAVAEGGYVHVDATELPPGTWISYQFVDAGGAGSAVGRMRTAPAPDDERPVRFGVTSCLNQAKETFPSLKHVRDRSPLDFFLFLGDTAYFDFVNSRESFRELYQSNLTAPGLAEVRPTTACIYTWDDHEFANDFDPTTITEERFATATGAWLENLPVRRDPETPHKIWRRLRYGRAVELFVLDCRTERDLSTGQYISPEQLDWLLEGLEASDATWKLIANSVPITSIDSSVWDAPRFLQDRWEGYPEQRAALLDAIADRGIEGVLFLAGDIHMGMLAQIEASGRHQRLLEIACGPGGSFTNLPGAFALQGDPQFLWAAAEFQSTHFELRVDGTAHIHVVDEANEDLAYFELNTAGQILAQRQRDLETGEMVVVVPAP